MKRFIEATGHYVTDEPSFMEKEHAMTPELSEKLQKLHPDVLKGKPGTAEYLLKLIGEHPRNPQLKNLLTSYYIVINEPEKAYAFNRKTIEAHPNYFFGTVNLVQEHINNQEYDKIIEILGSDFNLAKLYPERDTFHISEVMSMAKLAVTYFSHKEDFDTAESFIHQMKEIDEDDFEVQNAEMILLNEVLERLSASTPDEDDYDDDDFDDYFDDEDEDEGINVEVHQQEITTKTEKPTFNHSEIEIIYQQGTDVSINKLEELLLLPRATLIEDLVKVINDGIERYSYFENHINKNNENESSFVLHAINLLAELKAGEQLPVVLNFLKQSEKLIDFYLGFYLTENIWRSLYKLGENQLSLLTIFMKEPGVLTHSKITVSQAIAQIANISVAHRNEVIQLYANILEFYTSASLNDNVIDSTLIGHVINDLIDIKGKELLPEITELLNLNYVSIDFCGDLETIEHNINLSYENDHEDKILNLRELYAYFTERQRNRDDFFSLFNADKLPSTLYDGDKPFIAEKKIGRNEPCQCGSGKKYKKCCMK